ncbi:MAG: tetratricopeptide repeat protein, partial [Bacteroidales bacterium]|nr:tetratricopeptide repeat protein [Bacteroidales bacterium]
MGSLDDVCPMLKFKYIFLSVVFFVFLTSCSSTKNTAGTRWYHSFNTRYNVYFNGDMAYQEAMKSQVEGYKENYTEMILMYPVSALPKEKPNTGGPFDRSIEKAVKAIKTHSIQTKPERKSGKRNDPKYQEWMSRTEYNPFLHNAWMLLGKSQFHNGDFLQAASTFSYVSRIYNSQPEIGLDAKLWQARCYSELEWYYEAEDIIKRLDKNTLSNSLKDWYDTVYADLLIKQKRYGEAVPYLQTAIKAEKNKYQRTREKYLLGQVYAALGERDLAYNAFGEVSSANAPYILEFSAKIRQTEVFSGTDTAKITRQLRSMAKSSKNKDYLDQLYYALGNVYMSVPDTAKAIESYQLGVEKSVQQGIDKALNQIRLGDIYFNQKKFIEAQPNYAESLAQLKKEDESYPRVSHRSEILDELVVHLEAIQLQDSLLRLSGMSEGERLVVVEKLIEELRKKEEEERKSMERDEFLAEQENTRAELGVNRLNTVGAGGVLPPGSENSFYFYNPQVVALGKNTFQQKWGRRKLEDDWRRRNKSNPMFDPFAEEELADTDTDMPDENADEVFAEEGTEEGILPEEEMAQLSTDPYDPQYYLQQIPVTEEDIAASNLIVADGLYNAAVIYKEKLEDMPLAIATFENLNNRYPGNENKLMAYYHVYLIYLKEGNTAMSNMYKQKIRTEFPDSELAVAMADPEYEYNLRMLYVLPESLYQEAFEAYMNNNTNKIRQIYQEMYSKYNQSPLMPKFMFLNALSYVQQNDANGFKEQLRELINRYPEADVSVLAAEMMKGFQKGLILATGDNTLARGGLFNIRFGELGEDGEPLVDISEITFSPDTEKPYVLMMVYSQGSINENMLLYTVASFNFGNFTVNDFDLEKTTMGQIGLLQVKGFNNFREITQYIEMIYAPEGYANELEQAVLIVPMSVENYEILMKGKSLEEYMDFYEEHFAKSNQELVDRWRLKQEQELEDSFDETEEEIIEETDDVLEEEDWDTEGQVPEEENAEDSVDDSDSVEEEADAAQEIRDGLNEENLVVGASDTIKIEQVLPDSLAQDSIHVPTLSELEQQRMEQKMEEVGEQADQLLDKSSEVLDD